MTIAFQGFAVAPADLSRASNGVNALVGRVGEIEELTAEATRQLSGFHPWGMLGEIHLRDSCTSLMEEFSGHLRAMRAGFEGAGERLAKTGAGYAAADPADGMLAAMLAAAAERKEIEPDPIRELNPASRFYRDHKILHGVITSGPYPFGLFGNTVMDGVRLYGDITSDDMFNIGSDLAQFTQDVIGTYFSARSAPSLIRADPLGYLVNNGSRFLINALYWVKWAADWVTGDPIATGQAAYNYDSMATSVRGLAKDLDRALAAVYRDGGWEGEASEAARARLAVFSRGIAETGDLANRVAAMLQLSSAIMGSVEGIVRGVISDLVVWAARTWFSATMLAPATGGQSVVTAAGEITAASATSAGRVGAVLDQAASFLRRLSALMRRAMTAMAQGKNRAFTWLRGTPWGRRNLEFAFGSRYFDQIVRGDARAAAGARLTWRDYAASFRQQTRQLTLSNTVGAFGFWGYRTDKRGVPYPDGRQKLSIQRYAYKDRNGEANAFTAYPAPLAFTAIYALPFARALQYSGRAGEEVTAAQIDAHLSL
ncbi:WXG100 family type VII secretion target [Nonomuraea sp. NPDC002799]